MRPICFYSWILILIPAGVFAQNPVSTATRTIIWPGLSKESEGTGWRLFSKQYYCVSNWNASGISFDYASGSGRSSVLVCRDGIPGFCWYHLFVSHYRKFNGIAGMLQLRFSLIGLKNGPPVFRLGGNILTSFSISPTLILQTSMYDFPGWILNKTAATRGDPAMHILLFNEPGRLIGLATGFRISQSQFGPVTAGIRVKPNDQMSLIWFFHALPFGMSIGINWNFNGYILNGWLEHRNGLGLSPMVEISGE